MMVIFILCMKLFKVKDSVKFYIYKKVTAVRFKSVDGMLLISVLTLIKLYAVHMNLVTFKRRKIKC